MRSPAFQPIRFRFGIIIEQRDELGVGRREALVVGGAKAAVLPIADSAPDRNLVIFPYSLSTISGEPSSEPLSITTTSNGWINPVG